MSFLKDYDTLFNQILTDFKNQFPEADTSQGSLIYIKSACQASALWGAYKYQEYISEQIFPDTADSANLDRHGWVWDIARTYGETDAAYLIRLLDHIRRRPAGGNKYDYIKWALEINNVAAAYCYPLAQGLGTVDVVIVANETNTGSEIPTTYALITGTNDSVTADKLKDSLTDFTGVKKGDVVKNLTDDTQTTAAADGINGEVSLTDDIFISTARVYEVESLALTVKLYIDDVRPVTAKVIRVLPPTILNQDVTMTVTGSGIDASTIAADITAYMDTLEPDQTLYVSQLISIAIDNNADNANVTVPAADVAPAAYEMIRPGTINVT